MARKLFPATGQRLIFSAKPQFGAELKSAATTEVAIYEDEACTVLADITDTNDVAIEDSILTIGSNSLLPLFKGPDGVTELYAKIGSAVTALQVHDSESGGGGGDAGDVADDLATHEALTTTAHGGIVASNDSRLTDARTPLSHNHSASDITSGLATVATTGAYSDLSGKPTIPDTHDDIGAAASSHTHTAAEITSGLATVATTGAYSDLSGNPTIPTIGSKSILVTGATTYSGYTFTATAPYCASSADGHYMEWTGQTFDAGTYTISVFGQTNTDRAITKVQIDGLTVATLDWYSGSSAIGPLTQASVAISAGPHTIKLLVDGRHASASGWVTRIWSLSFIKTA